MKRRIAKKIFRRTYDIRYRKYLHKFRIRKLLKDLGENIKDCFMNQKIFPKDSKNRQDVIESLCLMGYRISEPKIPAYNDARFLYTDTKGYIKWDNDNIGFTNAENFDVTANSVIIKATFYHIYLKEKIDYYEKR